MKFIYDYNIQIKYQNNVTELIRDDRGFGELQFYLFRFYKEYFQTPSKFTLGNESIPIEKVSMIELFNPPTADTDSFTVYIEFRDNSKAQLHLPNRFREYLEEDVVKHVIHHHGFNSWICLYNYFINLRTVHSIETL